MLLVYGTRYGSTKEIAEKFEEVLKRNDFNVDLINLDEVKLKNLPSLNKYDGALIGSGIKINKITKSVKKFLKKNANNLKESNKVLGFFVSCATANNPEERPTARKKYIEDVLKDYAIEADLYEAFGGVIDLSDNSNLGSMMKKIMTSMSREDPNIKLGERNDSRDWQLITNFANKYCDLLNK